MAGNGEILKHLGMGHDMSKNKEKNSARHKSISIWFIARDKQNWEPLLPFCESKWGSVEIVVC